MNQSTGERNLNKNPFWLRLVVPGRSYFVKTPWWLTKIYPSYQWRIATKEKIIYLSFDDGPHPVVTPFVLDELKKCDAKASFFCIGKNVQSYPLLYQRILQEGHSTGNHTQHHLNGWQTNDDVYLQDVFNASLVIESSLFRPPYGRIKKSQARRLSSALGRKEVQVVMWDVLSGDFDEKLSKEKCLKNVLENTNPGSIIVFHDSEKAFPRLEYVLPRTLDFFSAKGYRFEKL